MIHISRDNLLEFTLAGYSPGLRDKSVCYNISSFRKQISNTAILSIGDIYFFMTTGKTVFKFHLRIL